jgi:hypothetical protein
MPHDVTMCSGDDCPLRARCYRAVAVACARQDWLARAPFDAARGECSWFWDVAAVAPTEAAIRERAHALWLARGCPEGDAATDWQRARAELEAAVGLPPRG